MITLAQLLVSLPNGEPLVSVDGFTVRPAERVLVTRPGPFALAGLSMGGYVAFEVMRRAPERVSRLALLDTSARPDTPDQSARRQSFLERKAALRTQGNSAGPAHPEHQPDSFHQREEAVNQGARGGPE